MTTTDHHRAGATSWRAPVLATAAIGVVLGVAAALTTGAPGVWGVVVGLVLTLASLGLGTLVLAWVTDISPGMSLVVALMTYTLQVVLLLAAYVVLRGDVGAREAVAGPWLGGTVVAATTVWLALQVRDLMTTRQPYFDLPGTDAPEAADRAPEAGTT